MYILDYFDISLLEGILITVMLLVWLYQLYFYIRYIGAVSRTARRERKGKIERSSKQEPVSVIVCAKNEHYNLSQYLHVLLTQDYPEYEVIVVDDGSEDETSQLLASFGQHFPHLRTTFVPKDARVISSKKLALTLAAKAARYDYLLMIDADCRPESDKWISTMMSGFTDANEIVLGYGAYFADKTMLNKLIEFDTLFIGLQYLGMAAAGHPYMGVGRNLAYRRSTFFSNKGFAGMLGQRAGDDDLFVNKVANGKNTTIQVRKESVTYSIPKQSMKQWLQQKERHLSVSNCYKASTQFRLAFEPTTRALFYLSLILIGIYGSLYTWLAASVLFLTRLIWQIAIINGGARQLGERPFGINILIYDIYLPLNNLFLLLHNKIRRKPLYW